MDPKEPRKFKHYARFETTARCLVDKEQGKFLSLASIQDLQSILPKDADKHPDLLPIAANACVINLANKNGDVVETETGLRIYKSFAHKFINVEHDRKRIVGYITNAALTKFHSNYALGSGSEIITEDGINGHEPFNVSVAGYIWRYAAPGVVKKLLESNDPDSPLYLSVAVSWELGFDEYKLMAGSKERGDDVEIIDDPKLIEAYAKSLKNGFRMETLDDGRPLYRLITEARLENGEIDETSVLPLGIGLTFSPAGDVAGVVTPAFEAFASEEDEPETENAEKEENSNENISHSANANVTSNIQNPMPLKSFTSIDDIKNLNDETAKEFSFANVSNVVSASIEQLVQKAVTDASVQWKADKDAIEAAEAKAKQEAAAALQKSQELETELTETKQRLEALEKAQNEALANQKFNERMSLFDEKYELTSAHRQVIASRVKGMSDEAFTAYFEGEFAAFASHLSKEALASKQTEETQKTNEAVASVTKTEETKTVAEEALANTKAEGTTVPNTPVTSQSFFEKYQNAFAGDAVTFEQKKTRK